MLCLLDYGQRKNAYFPEYSVRLNKYFDNHTKFVPLSSKKNKKCLLLLTDFSSEPCFRPSSLPDTDAETNFKPKGLVNIFTLKQLNSTIMNLMDIFQGQLSDDVLGHLSDHIGADKEQTATAASGIFATLLGGLANNASSEGGLSALGSALDRDHDGSMLDDIMGMVTGAAQNDAPASNALNGSGILGHILGDNQETAAQQVSQSSGLSMGQIMKLMPILAPIAMSVLGKAKSQGGLDLGGLAGILMGSAQQTQSSGGMGDLIGSVLGGLMGGGQQQQQPQQGGGGLLGSVLGSIFGK